MRDVCVGESPHRLSTSVRERICQIESHGIHAVLLPEDAASRAMASDPDGACSTWADLTYKVAEAVGGMPSQYQW